MSSSSSALIVVPARHGSTRLPGKPLLTIAGRTLLERVHAVARAAAELAGNCAVVVATDDARIAAHAQAIGAVVTMTDAALDLAPRAPMPPPPPGRIGRTW
jgi:3-deoxy-manno-octulosonate cytidylyltransferase (CMP-KDO synthetase)